MIEAGLQLMLLGMSVVFTFLVVLVALMTIMSAITRRFENPAAGAARNADGSPTPGPPTESSVHQNNPRIAAVLAAVAQHHRRRGGNAASANTRTRTNAPASTNTTSGDHR